MIRDKTDTARGCAPARCPAAEFFAAHGVEPDSACIDYYRRLWQAEDAASR